MGASPERDLLERAVHDLKNPLAVVRASLEWLEVELSGREDALDAIRDAAAASERLVTIVEDLDALARLDDHDAASGDPVPIVSVVNAVVEAASSRVGPRGLTVEAILPLAGPRKNELQLRGDRNLLGRSLAALVDATLRGLPTGACVEVTVTEAVAVSGGGAIEIGIALRGVVDAGLPEATLDALESSSLGVYLALRVVAAHGGSIAIVRTTSQPRIVVRLPA